MPALRYELKYLLPDYRMAFLREAIGTQMVLDPMARQAGGSYLVHSQYFDTPHLKCYFDKVEGVKRRFKLRIRWYGGLQPDAIVFLERKEKVLDPLAKTRVRMQARQVPLLLRGRLDGLPAPAHTWYGAVLRHAMRPTVTTIYRREPWVMPPGMDLAGNNLRVTFDTDLRAAGHHWQWDAAPRRAAGAPLPVLPGRFILEIKFNHHCPEWLARLVRSMDVVPRSASKYCLCMDAWAARALPGGLTALRWPFP